MREEWRDVAGTDGMYQVSNRGRARTWKKGKWGRAERPKVMSPGDDGHVGHLAINLCFGAGVRKRGKMHRLVAEAFIGPIPAGMDVRHLDGNPKNNDVRNLAFGTRLENMADALAHGTVRHGSQKRNAKVTEADVVQIRNLYATGSFTHLELGERFGMSREAIGAIVRRQAWARVA